MENGIGKVTEIPYAQFEKVGLSKKDVLDFKPDDLKALLSGRSTSLKEIDLKASGIDFKAQVKFSLTPLKDGSVGLVVHPVRSKIDNTFGLSEKEIDTLKNGKTVITPYVSLNGKKENHLFQVDKETNEIKHAPLSSIPVPDGIGKHKFTDQEKTELQKGNTLEFNNQGKTVNVTADLVYPNGLKVEVSEQRNPTVKTEIDARDFDVRSIDVAENSTIKVSPHEHYADSLGTSLFLNAAAILKMADSGETKESLQERQREKEYVPFNKLSLEDKIDRIDKELTSKRDLPQDLDRKLSYSEKVKLANGDRVTVEGYEISIDKNGEALLHNRNNVGLYNHDKPSRETESRQEDEPSEACSPKR